MSYKLHVRRYIPNDLSINIANYLVSCAISSFDVPKSKTGTDGKACMIALAIYANRCINVEGTRAKQMCILFIFNFFSLSNLRISLVIYNLVGSIAKQLCIFTEIVS